jgi:hypothetical protein
LSIRELRFKVVEGLDTSAQMPRFVQRTILFQLFDEAHQRILDIHFVSAQCCIESLFPAGVVDGPEDLRFVSSGETGGPDIAVAFVIRDV